ncbi:MAG: DNA gyrase inhibitor YacG [Hyphomicrobiaceae bacterium]|nr:MAG: DNA gyrase inhibitor YacG [Hyphomicrobiaceae bacterium]
MRRRTTPSSRGEVVADEEEGKRRSVKLPRCPICGRPSDQVYRPFCSRRCADVDLARWLSGNYAVAGHADAEEDGALPSGQPDEDPKVH